jgi:glycosyltransferase involved in cell wall biosynthesis
LARLYRDAWVFVFPSLYEGFGLPLLEAMSAGTPVVAHHASAMAEVVADAGYLVDMTDVSAIAVAVQRALQEVAMGKKGLDRARNFSRERMARETLGVYRKALKID